MKKALFIFAGFFLQYCILSQNFSIVQGERFSPELNSEFSRYIGCDSNAVFMERTSLKGTDITHLIQKIDSKSLKTIFNKDMTIGDNEKIIESLFKNNKIFVFTTKNIKKENKKQVLLREYNPISGNLNTIKEIAAISYETKSNISDFHIAFSPDESNLAIVTESNQNGIINASYDIYETITLGKLWHKQATYKSTEFTQRKLRDERFEIVDHGHETLTRNDYKLSDNGFLIYSIAYISDQKELTGSIAYQYIAKESEDILFKVITDDKIDIQNCSIECIGNDILLCGLYKDIITKQDKKGDKIITTGFTLFY
jgi:hypothetical protein